jgi:MFS family permease
LAPLAIWRYEFHFSGGGQAMSAITDVDGVPDSHVEAAYPKPAYAWYVLGVLFLAFIFAFLDRQILFLLVGPIRRDLHISDTEMSLLSGFAFAVFFALFGFPLARLADAKSRRGLIAIGFVLWSVFTAACGLAGNFTQMFVMRIGVGVGEASLNPSAYSLITDYFPPQRRATALSFYNMGIYVGSGFAFLLGGVVIGLTASHPEYDLPLIGAVRSWQLVFFLIGLPGLACALLLLSVAEPPRRGPGAGASSVPIADVLKYLAKHRATFASLNIGTAVLAFAAYGGAAWIPSFFIRHHHWSPALTGEVFGLLAIFAALGCASGGLLADHIAKRGYPDACLRTMILAAFLGIPFTAGYLLIANSTISAVLLAPTLFLSAMVFGVAPAALMEVAPARMRGQAGALYAFCVNFFGLGFGPTTVALLTDYLFHDDNMVGYSLLIVAMTAHAAAILILWSGLKTFVRSKDELARWGTRPATT